jgi:hypothetical protein
MPFFVNDMLKYFEFKLLFVPLRGKRYGGLADVGSCCFKILIKMKTKVSRNVVVA